MTRERIDTDSKSAEGITRLRKPEWLKVKLPAGKNYSDVRKLVHSNDLHTVCEEAHCPNIGECWNNRTATFMILGDTCTRNCRFCNVKTGATFPLDNDEPRRVAESVRKLQLKHAVITSVTRDDQPDGGAGIFSEMVRQIRIEQPDCTIEILIPDFQGNEEAFGEILKNPPDILNHNIETVPRLYKTVRPQAEYERSLRLLRWFKEAGLLTKSGLMVGLGETKQEVFAVLDDLRKYGCDIVTIGQYLQPSKKHLPVDRYVNPDEFKEYEIYAKSIGFLDVVASPLVRSSYHADRQAHLSKK